MIKLTQSLMQWLIQNGYKKDIPLICFGHIELLTQEMYDKYLEWVQTDEGKQYLEGGSKYNANINK